MRDLQAGGPKLRGPNRLLPEQHYAITEAVSKSALVALVKEAADVDLPLNYLAERFEEMARRRGVSVDNYPSDPRGFLRRVGEHIDALAQDPEFARFHETPDVFTTAAVGYPSDPRGFLRRVSQENHGWTIRELNRQADHGTVQKS